MTGNYEKENDIKRLISFMVISILAFCVKSVIEKYEKCEQFLKNQ